MSVIFDAMLVFEMPDREGIEHLNRLLYEKDAGRHQQFREINMGGAGGSKFFTLDIYAAAFNHLVPSDVEACICATKWRYADRVLYVMDLGDYMHDEDRGLSARTVASLVAERQNEARGESGS